MQIRDTVMQIRDTVMQIRSRLCKLEACIVMQIRGMCSYAN
jgi:hypothetical protein